MKTSKALKGWRNFGTRAVAVLLTALLATQMVGTPAFASGEYATDSEQENTITNDVTDVTMDPAEETTAGESTEAEEATPQEEQQPADDSEEPQATQEQSATDPADDGSTEGASSDSSDEVASVTLDLADTASITYGEETITDDTDPLEVPANQELKFSASADEGFQIESVKAVIDGTETELTADANGEYTVPAEQVTDALTVKVETTEILVEEATAEEETAEEPEVVEPAEVVADVSSPAFEGYAYVNDIVVKVTAGEGVLPEGTTVSAYQVNRQDVIDAVESYVEGDGETELKNSVAIDVTLIGPAGDVIQPEGAVNVCFFNTQLGDGDINVFRVADDASSVVEIGARQAEAAVQSFDVDHFSIYVVGEAGEPVRATYNFYVGDVDEPVSTQIVKNGETLYEPETPKPASDAGGQKFIGWYTAPDGGNQFTSFGQAQVSSSETINLYARFQEAHYVFFYDNQGRIFHTEECVTDEEVDATAITVPGLALNQGLTGWYSNQALEGNAVETVKMGEENVYLWPKVEDGHWITFDSDGGTYIEPEFVSAGQDTQEPDDPTRTGYAFAGWETPDGLSFDFGSTITGDVELIANWTPGKTSYRVIYWVEKANWTEADPADERYSYMSTELVQNVDAGTQTNAQGLTQGEWSNGDLAFNDAELQEIQQQTVEGDGSTTVNIYYNRKTYRVVFMVDKPNEWVLTCTKTEHEHEYADRQRIGGIFGGYWEYTGKCYGDGWHREGDYQCGEEEHVHSQKNGCFTNIGGWQEEYAIEAKVGAYIGDQWPTDDDVTGGPYRWALSQGGRTWQAHMEVMPSGGATFWAQTASGTSTATYWVESLSGNPRWEKHHSDVSAGTGAGVTKEDKYDLQGFTYSSGTRDGDSYNGSNFYYTRNSYSVVFFNGNADSGYYYSATKLYEASLADLDDIKVLENPPRPDGVDPDYIFAGWYDNQYGEGSKFNFDTTMPAYNINLYAVWKAPEVSVTVYGDMAGTSDPTAIGGIEFGQCISEDQMPEAADIDDMMFVGWATRTGEEGNYTYELFNFDSQIRSDVVLYPYYISTGSFSVTYDANNGTNAPSDTRKYAEDSYADALHPDGMTCPDGKVFIGWNTEKDGTGTPYQPEDKILIEDNVTLYAQWGDSAATTSITYEPNYPEGSAGAGQPAMEDGIALNADYTVKSNASLGITAPDGYYFVGWSKTADGTGDIAPESTIIFMDNQLTNTLYAIWKQKTEITITASSKTVTYNGSEQKVDTFEGQAQDGSVSVVAGDGKTYTITNVTTIAKGTDANVEGYPTQSSTENAKVECGGTDVTDQVQIKVTEGTLTITKRPVTFTGQSDTRAYNGSEIELTGVSTNDGEKTGLVSGHTSNVAASAKGTVAGKYGGTITDEGDVVIKDAGQNDVTGNYEITTNPGTLTITGVAGTIVITADSAEKVYDGSPLTDSGFTSNADGILLEGDRLEATVTGSATNYGDEGKNVVTGYRVMRGEGEGAIDVTKSYTFGDSVEGTLTIEQATIIVTADSKSKTFGNNDPVLTYNAPAVVGGEDPAFIGSLARVSGEAPGAYAIQQNDLALVDNNESGFLAGNYTIKYVGASLTIHPQSIDPTDPVDPDDPDGPDPDPGAPDPDPDDPTQPWYDGATIEYPDDVVYNGASQEQPVIVTAGGQTLVEGTDYTVSYTPAVNAGTVTVTVTGIGNYGGSTTGTYQITPAPLTVTTPDGSKVYDGTALTAGPVTLTGLKGTDADTVTATATGSQTEVGQSVNGYTIDWNGVLSGNYTITENLGTLTVGAVPPVSPLPGNPGGGNGGQTPTPLPTTGTGDDGAAADAAATDDTTATIEDETVPLAAERTIDDNATPMSAGNGQDCWIHWIMILGIVVTVVYAGVVIGRRSKFTGELKNYEDKILGNDENNQ